MYFFYEKFFLIKIFFIKTRGIMNNILTWKDLLSQEKKKIFF